MSAKDENHDGKKIILTTNPLEVQGNDEVATIWQGSSLIASLSASPGRDRGQQLGKKLVDGFNNTHADGINPAAIHDMKLAILSFIEGMEGKEEFPGHNQAYLLEVCLPRAKDAIEKAKL